MLKRWSWLMSVLLTVSLAHAAPQEAPQREGAKAKSSADANSKIDAKSKSNASKKEKSKKASSDKITATKSASKQPTATKVTPSKVISSKVTKHKSSAQDAAASKAQSSRNKETAKKPKEASQKETKPNVSNAKLANPKAELNQIHERIETLTKQLETAQEAHADVTDALKESEKSISDTNRKLFELNQQHQQNRSTLLNLQRSRASLETTIQAQKLLLASQYYRQYVHGEQNYMKTIMQAQQPSDMARQLVYYRYIADARHDLIAELRTHLGEVVKLNDQTASTLKQISSLKTEQEKQRLTLVNEKHARNQVLQQLSSQMSAQRNEIEKLKRDEKSLSDLVERLARELAAKAARPKKQRNVVTDKRDAGEGNSPTPTRQNTPIARNETLPTDAFQDGDFATLRGKLNLPVRGEVTNRFGESREDTGVSWKGLFIKSAEGNEVKSVAPGRVVFADWMRGFGNLLIIDHGDGYMSLYGNNQGLLRKVGDTVKAGDTVASVGNSGGNETSGLYYELRKQSRPFDPMSWSIVR